MKIQALIVLLSSVPLLGLSSTPINQNADFLQHKNQLRQDLDEKSTALTVCYAECRSKYQHYTKEQCNSGMCSSQKSAYNQAKRKVDEIAMSQHVVNTKESTLAGMKNRWNACTSQCLNKPNNKDSAVHCRNVICQSHKKQYKAYQAHSDNMDENKKIVEEGEEDSKNKPEEESSEAVVNQIREKRDKVGALAYVAAGTTAYLGYKAAVCYGQCGGFGGGCCSQAPMYAGMAVLGAVQTTQMFKKRRSLNQTCSDLSTNGMCNSTPEEEGGSGKPEPPNPLPPGCELNPSACDPCNYDPESCIDPPPIVDSPPVGTPTDIPPYSPTGSLTGVVPNLPEIFEGMEPNGGWPNGQNPFEDNEEFDYNDLSPAQKNALKNAMKAFNQRKKNYMAKNGLLGKGGSTGVGSSDSDGSKTKGGLLAENLEDDLDLGSGFSSVKDPTGSLTGSSTNKGSRGRRASNREPNTIDKMKEMLKKMSGGDSPNSDLSKMSVSIGNDSVGVREDNIFLMVHRMNRKLDEEQRRFIIDF